MSLLLLKKKEFNKLLPGGQDGQICWKECIVVDLDNVPNHHIEPLNPQPLTISQHFHFTMIDFIIRSMSFLCQICININTLESHSIHS